MVKKTKKIYILDTNVILHDWKCIYAFKEHDVVISTKVIEEIDTFKKGNESRHYNARNFIKIVDSLRMEKEQKGNRQVSKLSNSGVFLGDEFGKMRIVVFKKHTKLVGSVFPERTVDNSLLSSADQLQKENPNFDVILVTKDVNVRLKADSLNILSEDYKKDQLDNSDSLPKGKVFLEDFSLAMVIDSLYDRENNGCVSYVGLDKKLKFKPIHNLYVILRAGRKSVLARVDAKEKQFVYVKKLTKFGITPKNAEQVFAMDAVLNTDIKLVTLFGPAGTGKTLMAIVAALELLKQKKCERVVISAAIVPVDNKDIGFLPGDMVDKVSPYMKGIEDNISLIKTHVKRNGDQQYVEIFDNNDGVFEVQPLSFIRGRSINDTVFIIDEAQNTTPHEMLTAITRAGENTKIVLCGDTKQVDSPYLSQLDNGLVHVITRFFGQEIFANIHLKKGERSELATLASELLV